MKIIATIIVTALHLSVAQANDDYLSDLDAEASKITISAGARNLQQQRRKLMLSAPSASTQITSKAVVFDKRARRKDVSSRGFSEILRFQAAGSFELYQQLSPSNRQDVIDAYNAGAKIEDIRPMITTLFQ